MQIVLDAIYKNGVFVLNQNLGVEKEGKKFKILALENEKLEVKKERFFQFIKKHSFPIPEDYKFIREDIYER
ncbi:MAG: hypothetical protein ACE5HS_23555 [bacterium]